MQDMTDIQDMTDMEDMGDIRDMPFCWQHSIYHLPLMIFYIIQYKLYTIQKQTNKSVLCHA